MPYGYTFSHSLNTTKSTKDPSLDIEEIIKEGKRQNGGK